MALTPEQIKNIRQQIGFEASGPQDQASNNIARRRELAQQYDEKSKQEPNYFQRVWNRWTEGAKDLITDVGIAGEQARQASNAGDVGGTLLNLGRGSLRTVGEVAEQAFTPIMEAPGVKEGLEKVGEGVTKLPGASWLFEKINEFSQSNPELAKDLQNVLDVASLGLGKATEQTAKVGLEQVAAKSGEIAGKVRQGVTKATEATERGLEVVKPVVKEAVSPSPTPMKAVGEVLQGKTKDVTQGVRALSSLDTQGVKTFQDLGQKIKSKIRELAKQVDEDLGLDKTTRKLDELKSFITTPQGTTVVSNSVENALNQLSELYTKIGDNVKFANLQDLISKAKNIGLTNKEINQLARNYNSEFGSKAFSKLGDPLTSVNAQMYENTRKALKDFARQGITGTEAKVADETMSALYNTQTLIKKNIEAVNKLKQKIAERGMLEKIGHTVSKYADIFTGGGLRGFVGGLLPRGAGYKTLNALDLESVLERNLKIIQDAIKSKSDDEIIKLLEQLNKSKK